jgi:hypothetical protein
MSWLGRAQDCCRGASQAGQRTQYAVMQISEKDVPMKASAALKPLRPFDTAGGLTTDWICAAEPKSLSLCSVP